MSNIFFFFVPECIHHSGQEDSPRLPLIYNASLHHMGQQYLPCNLLVPAQHTGHEPIAAPRWERAGFKHKVLTKGLDTLKTPVVLL